MDYLIFIAPPAFGKTQWIKSYIKSYPDNLYLIISPLRALAQEMMNQFSQNFSCYQLWEEPKYNWISWLGKPGSLMITTPEKIIHIPEGEWLSLMDRPIVIIWDEWHLIDIWGNSFRPSLMEAKYLLCSMGFPLIGLTATLENQIENSFDSSILISYGNYCFFRPPHKIYFYFSQKQLENKLKDDAKKESQTILYFVPYRKLVNTWKKWANKNDISFLGCVGGETVSFSKEILLQTPRLIVSTSALSHGVNLPSLSKVYIYHPELDKTFWIQMASRGGRKGERYEVHVKINFYLLRKMNVSSWMSAVFRFMMYRFKEIIFGN